MPRCHETPLIAWRALDKPTGLFCDALFLSVLLDINRHGRGDED